MATSKTQILVGTALKVNGEAGADHAFSMEGITDGNGRVSIQIDLGASPRNIAFKFKAEALMQATPTQGDSINFYIATAPDNDSSMITGDVGASDAALGDIDQLRNIKPIGSLVMEEADTTKMVGGGEFVCLDRYLTIVGENQGGSTINATDSNFIFNLEPYDLQGQAT